METKPLEVIQSFVAKLLTRHREIKHHQDEDQSLVYANSLLIHQLQRNNFTDLPPLVVVIGPTQAGKSTITNLLVGAPVAEASPLAGFTRHASGYVTQAIDKQITEACDTLLPGLNRVSQNEFSADRLDCFALQSVQNTQAFRQPLMIWDTPDFDSVSSRSYRSTVPMLCAIADLIVLVVSKDKYADQTVWETLRLVGKIKRPLLVCINKIPSANQNEILKVVKKKFIDEKIEAKAITTLPLFAEENTPSLLKETFVEQFRELAAAHLHPAAGPRDSALLGKFIHHHWNDWTMAVNDERMARRQWEETVRSTLKESAEAYARDYLHDPNYGDTIQRAIARLLELLEIPGIAAGLARTRQAITWPARKLTAYFKKKSVSGSESTDHETQILNDVLTHLSMQLQRAAGERAATAPDNTRLWWQQLWRLLETQSATLAESRKESIRAHQINFEPHIEVSAQHLYEHLQQHPATLNGLRAARVSTDAAAVVLALKTGGIGLNDLILAPAMLSFSTMLAEGAVGRYMSGVEKKLKKIQLESVNTYILSPLQERLIEMPVDMETTGLYGLLPEELDAANKALGQL